MKELIAVYKALNAGTLHCRFVAGDREGSIAKLTIDPDVKNEPPLIRHKYGGWNNDKWKFQICNYYFSTICTWKGRKNKVKLFLPHREVELLLNYNGPTIWEKFDAKAAKEEVLKNPDQRDIDGNVLCIGDSVLFINARYGTRMVLSRGTITEFKVVANSRGATITTVINDEGGARSELSYPQDMVYKIPRA